MKITLNKNSPYSKILLLTAGRVGDALFCTPAIRVLKQNLPAIQFDILAFSNAAASVFKNNPDVNQIFTTHSKLTTRKLIAKYPLIINLMHEMLAHVGTQPPKNFISIGLPDRTKHRVTQALEFVNSLLEISTDSQPSYTLNPQPEDFNNIKLLLNANHIDPQKDILIGCQLGCHRVAGRWWQIWSKTRHQHKKVWPIENYIALAKNLKQLNSKIQFILTGAETEKFLAKQFLNAVPWATDLIGKTSLFELAALIDSLRVYVTHDTGSLHIACTRKTPLIALYGPTKLAFTGPHSMQADSIIIHKNKMTDITVSEVYDAVKTYF